jgi:predicted aspartyl protease
VITGEVSDDGVPLVELRIADQTYSAIIDTGFNGDVELPLELKGKLNDQSIGRLRSVLAGGQFIEEDAYTVDLPFDGEVIRAVATFAFDAQILIGTNLLRRYALRIGFASRYVELERE